MQNEASAARRYTSVFASLLASNVQAPTAGAASRVVNVAALLSVASGFDASASTVEMEPAELETEQLTAVAMVAWKQYREVGDVLTSSVKALRNRISTDQYARLLEMMPGFMI